METKHIVLHGAIFGSELANEHDDGLTMLGKLCTNGIKKLLYLGVINAIYNAEDFEYSPHVRG